MVFETVVLKERREEKEKNAAERARNNSNNSTALLFDFDSFDYDHDNDPNDSKALTQYLVGASVEESPQLSLLEFFNKFVLGPKEAPAGTRRDRDQ